MCSGEYLNLSICEDDNTNQSFVKKLFLKKIFLFLGYIFPKAMISCKQKTIN